MRPFIALGALLGLSTTALAGTCTIHFYKDQCYGPEMISDYQKEHPDLGDPQKCSAGQLTWNAGCYDYPVGAHFMSTGDACGSGACMQVQFYGSTDTCGGGDYKAMTVGTGCYNINVGFQPHHYIAQCISC